MFSFKQLEALYWIDTLGGFAAAARKLNTTQSAISKRVKELEAIFETELFDRDNRQARLTEKGEEMLMVAKRLLEQRDAAVEQFSKAEIVERRLRIGITELTAMTWLPRLVRLVRQHYPKVVIEPDVDLSVNLRDKLLADEVDIIIVPDAFSESRFSVLPLASVKSVWMAKPGLLPVSRTLRMHELAAHTILTQGGKSGTGIIYERWFKSQAISPSNSISSNSLVALIGLTVSGLGVSYLPYLCLRGLIERGALEVVETTPSLPQISYVVLYRGERKSGFISSILMLAQECCDFSDLFQIDETIASK
ncbi:bacterial regulatory helix-turn-helix, lysR family protein [Collimonas fungivorans]|uniref:Bacterial regulatory helix-turn-helix, lysR family protein n=1 Tax=Collimonas fungivorans TaxID=158899 RepID=A0A127P6A4_9BURK|nr:LysR family transcriptional regulator [Collimonas fungivorans]AMO93204.1 bacterial regulatory helix-turn-helix, lysR family protein [Collimonas fungivorans]